jgi:5-bromo-4-chloroindolyl phosphate hydrolysis protein
VARKESLLPGIVGGLLGAGLFIIIGPVMRLGLPFSLAGAVAGLVGGFFIAKKEPSKQELSTGISDQDLESTLQLGQNKINRLKQLKYSIDDKKISSTVESLISTTEKILLEVKRDPTDVPAAHYFLQYYTDSTESLLKKYQALKNSGSQGEKEQKVIQSVEELLFKLEGAYKQQLSKLLENDVLDLETEVEMIQSSLNNEGLLGE